jgi:hypothetical protein
MLSVLTRVRKNREERDREERCECGSGREDLHHTRDRGLTFAINVDPDQRVRHPFVSGDPEVCECPKITILPCMSIDARGGEERFFLKKG